MSSVPVWERKILIQIHLMLIFITDIQKETTKIADSNTSHVNLYLAIAPPSGTTLSNSNTSHVNLYPSLSTIWIHGTSIQIHLMLIFIRNALYSLRHAFWIQIHLMLIFIGSWWRDRDYILFIQIHLMLIFIRKGF